HGERDRARAYRDGGRARQPARRGVRFRRHAAVHSAARRRRRYRACRVLPRVRGGGLGDRPAAGGRRRHVPQLMAHVPAKRAGAILAVSDFEAALAFYRDRLGLDVEAVYDDPPYATLTAAGARISLAEHGHPAEDRPGVMMAAPDDPTRANVVLVLEVDDARQGYPQLADGGRPL